MKVRRPVLPNTLNTAAVVAKQTADPAAKPRPALKPGPVESQLQSAIRVLVAYDQPIVRHGVTHCLAEHKHLVVVGEAENGREAVVKAKRLSPDVVVMDAELSSLSSLAVIQILRKESPNIKVVILPIHTAPECVEQIVQSGAQGCLSKKASPQQLMQAIEAVSAGRSFFRPDLAQVGPRQFLSAAQDSEALSPRESQVLGGIAEGLTNKEIAKLLSKSVRTIEMHRARLMRKLKIHNAVGLTKFAIAKGLAPPPSSSLTKNGV